MERLTARTEKGLAYLVNVKPDEQVVESPYKNTLQCILDCFDRLAAYEDTGLTPEEVNACKHALMGREIAKITEFDGISLDRLEEICNAERDGRIVVLPCKVGDTVYLIIHGYVEETKVRTFFVGHPSYNRGEPDPRYEMVRCTNYDLPLKDFGKTVFLTREAAEAALKERE